MALEGEKAARQIYGADFDLLTRVAAPLLEARYKSFDRFVGAHESVFELAVGTSVGRGLMISDDQTKLYIGSDLPGMIERSRKFIARIKRESRSNHYLEVANVLSYEELSDAARHFGSRRDVAIIHEGLWLYLTTKEQIAAADNIRRLLEHYGGVWVTPDIWDVESVERMDSSLGHEVRSAIPRISQRLSCLTGRDLKKNYFKNSQEATCFLEKFGFEVHHHPMIEDLLSLVSIRKLWGEREYDLYADALRQRRVWTMSLR